MDSDVGRASPPKEFTIGTSRSIPLERGVNLRRYWVRGLIGILVPLAVTIYWFLVWFVYLIPENPANPVQFGHSGGRWVYYSWFLIAIFGINLSKYSLRGVEAAMMMDPRWAAKNAMEVMVGDPSVLYLI